MGGGVSDLGTQPDYDEQIQDLDEPIKETNPYNIPDVEDGYVPPRPPWWKKKDVYSGQNIQTIDAKAKKVKAKKDTTFEELASVLTQGLVTDLQRVRSLFIWTGSQDVQDKSYPADVDVRTPLGFLMAMKDGLGAPAYPFFFANLCRAANIPCVIIWGTCKGTGYEVGDESRLVADQRGVWNAVYIDGSWQIVHPMWAFSVLSGHSTGRWTKIESEGKFTRERPPRKQGLSAMMIDEDMFLPPPEEFLYRCMADRKEWQLVKDPWDMEKFCNVPYLQPEYFTSRYKLVSPRKATIISEEGKCEVVFREKEGVQTNLAYELYFDEEQSEVQFPSEVDLPRCVLLETIGNLVKLTVRLHVIGVYKLSIKYSPKGISTDIAAFRLETHQKANNGNVFPINPAIGFGYGRIARERGLTNPSHTAGVIINTRRSTKTLRFKNTSDTKIIAKLCHNTIASDKLDEYIEQVHDGDYVSIRVTMPTVSEDDQYALQIYQREDVNVLNYLFTGKDGDFKKPIEKKEKKRIPGKPFVAWETDSVHNDNVDETIQEIEEVVEATNLEREKEKRKARHKRRKKEKAEKDKEEEEADTVNTLVKATRERNRMELEEAVATSLNSGVPVRGDLTSALDALCNMYEKDTSFS